MTPDKHIEFVQQIIARMNGNSFQLKTWAVTLTAGLFALSERSNPWFPLLALIPIIVFWLIDAYYLQMERHYRDLYDHLCTNEANPAYARGHNYNLDPSHYGIDEQSFWKIARSKTQIWIYLPLLISVGLVTAALRIFGVN
jgi:hypothetical protein